MQTILVISYYFPPSAKAGSHRAYSIAEFLPRFGWQPVFIAPVDGYYGRVLRLDDNLLEVVERYPVYRTPVYYPFNNQSTSLLARIGRRLWELLWVPDGKRTWNRSVRKQLPEIIRRHKPDVVLITSTPFSTFLLAPHIKKKFGLPVVLDYRDPWADSPVVERNRLKAALAVPLERWSVRSADLLTGASYHIVDYVRKTLGTAAEGKRFFGFPYGYNGQMFRDDFLRTDGPAGGTNVVGTFAGFVHGDIDFRTILRGIKHAVSAYPALRDGLKIRCYGTLFGSSLNPDRIISEMGLSKWVEVHPFLPYRDFLKTLRESSFLILPHGDSEIARVLYPTKFFDFLGVRRPILYIGGVGQVSETIEQCNAGICVQPDSHLIADALMGIVGRKDDPSWYSGTAAYEKLDRENIFAGLALELNRLARKTSE